VRGLGYLRLELAAVLLLLLLCLGVLDGVVGKVEAAVDDSLTPLALGARLTGNEVAEDGEAVFNNSGSELVDALHDDRSVNSPIQTVKKLQIVRGLGYLRLELAAVLLLLLLCLVVLDGVVGKVEATVDDSLAPLALWARLTRNEISEDGEAVLNDARAELVDTFPDGRPVYASIQTFVNHELNKPIKYLRLKFVELAFENFHIIQFAGNELAGDG
jgi:hypothetical protein